jgi:penicillin amidase
MSVIHNLIGAALKPVLVAMSRRRLPQLDGRIKLDGLSGEVTVHRDEWGIPHVRAARRSDLFFAQGFLQSQDRLWQMELNRRVATGRVAEIMGPAGLEIDRLVRTLGIHRLAAVSEANMNPAIVTNLSAFCDGVNAYLACQPPLPVELTLLGHQPEPWRTSDSVAIGRLQAWALSHGWAGELVRARVTEAVGQLLAQELELEYPPKNPVTLAKGIEHNRLAVDNMVRTAAAPLLGKGTHDGAGRGSNGWVIAPWRSATGRAILCNDMHLPVSSPSLWYYMHLCSDEPGPQGRAYHAAGVSLPGVPYILVGHNERIAWGATLTFIDVEDLFIEKTDGNLARYEYQGEWYARFLRSVSPSKASRIMLSGSSSPVTVRSSAAISQPASMFWPCPRWPCGLATPLTDSPP